NRKHELDYDIELNRGALSEIDRQLRERDVAAHREAVGGTAHAADEAAVAVHGLASVDGPVLLAADEQRPQPRRRLPVELGPLVLRDREADPGVERRVGGGEVAAEVAVALLDPQRVEGLVADRLGVES